MVAPGLSPRDRPQPQGGPTRRILILLATHLLTLGLGFGLGVYLLPILIAPDDPPVEQVQAAMKTPPTAPPSAAT